VSNKGANKGANKEANRKAVVLLSGGLDSSTVLAMAQDEGYECYCLSFNYGQKHLSEIKFAKDIAINRNVADHKVVHLDIANFGGSALTDEAIEIPVDEEINAIPVTYVPARNTVFLSYALGYAEVLEAHDIFIGVNAVDYSGYPDCRPEFIEAFETMANLATRIGVEGESVSIQTPLIHMSKAEIIRVGLSLGIDYSLTVSCYKLDENGFACGCCDSCRIRRTGFLEAGIDDPTQYR